MIKKIIALAVIVVMSLGIFALSGCTGKTAYFTYKIRSIGDDSPSVTITGLTKKGHKQKYLVIPEKIRGRTVDSLEKDWGENNVLEKLYFESAGRLGRVVWEDFVGFTKLEKIIIMTPLFYKGSNQTANYLSRIEYEKIPDDFRKSLLPANISYYYNYDTSEIDFWWSTDRIAGYYWIDDVEYGEKIEFIPPSPTRKGYKFGGWYKEPECINEWDFNTDTLPAKQTDTEGKTIYQETELYAKWIKK